MKLSQKWRLYRCVLHQLKGDRRYRRNWRVMLKTWIIMTIVGIISCLLLGIGGAVGYAINDEFGLLIGMGVMCIFISVILRGYRDISFILSALLFRKRKKSGGVGGRDDISTIKGTVAATRKFRGILKHPSVKIIIPVLALAIGFTIYYEMTFRQIRELCWEAEKANSLEQRRSFLQQAGKIPNLGSLVSILPWTTASSDPMTKCEWVQDELDSMLVRGECSKYILKDVACKCGEIDWIPDAPVYCRLTSESPMCFVINWNTMEHKIVCE